MMIQCLFSFLLQVYTLTGDFLAGLLKVRSIFNFPCEDWTKDFEWAKCLSWGGPFPKASCHPSKGFVNACCTVVNVDHNREDWTSTTRY